MDSLNIISGKKFPKAGYWGYDGHIDKDVKCTFEISSYDRMTLYLKGETAPHLGSCNHLSKWKFMGDYRK